MTVEQKTWYIVLMVYIALLTAVVEGKQPGVLLQEGLYAEEIDGDLDKAIAVYQQVVDDPQATEAQGAQSLYRMGMCYLKKQEELKAKGVFQSLIEKYPKQTKVIDKIRPLLAKLVDLDPASLMPPHTKIYFEIGSPGRQIEKIMNMLQGTPLENPLQALTGIQGENPPPKTQAQGQTPMGMLSALLNPSMMAELKKIRGLAVGVTEIRQSNPPMVAVLNPGKSDALRGLILAGLGMIGQPGAVIEGMQTREVQLDSQTSLGIAHDDTIILFSIPQEQLGWCVKQYKGITNEPTLVTAHKQFAKIPRERRLGNTFTLWVDGKETYAALAPMLREEIGEFGLIDGFVNFGSIQEVLAEFAIEETGFSFEGNVHLDSDHRCLPYQMFRTPNLRKSGFAGVPANAIAVLSFSLGGPEGALAAQTSESIKAATGLDIGREIFNNIEQVTVFAIPVPEKLPEDIFAQELSPLLHSIGVAITSRNPEKTRTLLSQLLHAGEAFTCVMFNRPFPEESDPIRPKYFVAGIPGPERFQELYLHIDQVEHTTVLALNRQVIDASIAAVRSEKSALTHGPLQKSLAALPKETSKLFLINVGGALGLYESHMRATELAGKEDHPLFDILAKLKKGFAETMIQMRTGETANHLAVRMSIEDLPPLAEVFPTLMQIPQMMMEQQRPFTGASDVAGSDGREDLGVSTTGDSVP